MWFHFVLEIAQIQITSVGAILFTKEQVAQFFGIIFNANYFSVDGYDLGQQDIAVSLSIVRNMSIFLLL